MPVFHEICEEFCQCISGHLQSAQIESRSLKACTHKHEHNVERRDMSSHYVHAYVHTTFVKTSMSKRELGLLKRECTCVYTGLHSSSKSKSISFQLTLYNLHCLCHLLLSDGVNIQDHWSIAQLKVHWYTWYCWLASRHGVKRGWFLRLACTIQNLNWMLWLSQTMRWLHTSLATWGSLCHLQQSHTRCKTQIWSIPWYNLICCPCPWF